ncbi:MAG TPA: beta-ketoacyl-[acyl-carrier-protein] synthase family protein [Vicinamibacterales bacterium]
MPANGHPGVVITGIGVVSPFGVGRDRFWEGISRGESGTRAITQFDVSTSPCQVAAWVPPVSIEDAPRLDGDDDLGKRADPRRYSRAALFGVVAAREAFRDAGLRAGEPHAGVIIGSGGGGIDIGEKQYEDFFTAGGHRVTPFAIAVGICGMLSSEISISLGLRGQSHVLSCGCTSSTDAIGYAASLIRSGEYDVLLSGGTDGCVVQGMIFGFTRMRAVSTRYNNRPAEASRPFDRGRDGFVLGEGAWMLVLEREDRAIARGATRYARIESYAATCDAYHRVQMDPDGGEIVRCIETALARADRHLTEIGYVNYHGTATQLNDTVESQCVRRVFGEHADRVPGSSTKSMIGHPQGASGAAGVVAAVLALTRGVLPPTINLRDQDPTCDMDFIPNTARAADIDAALCNCLGFGSKNSALVLGRVR